jgi:DNA-binding response OmpR family regulator
MIMLLTHRADLRGQIAKSLEAKGHAVCIPPHRTDVTTETKHSQPDLVVLDMYLDDPAGNTVLQNLRQDGYKGMVIALSGPSQVVSMEGARALGLQRILKLPVQVAGSYDLGELETAVETAFRV